KEFETSRYLVERLDALSPDRLEAGVAGTGVVADLKGTRPGRAVLVRADIDALPIQEAGELAFRSSHRGVMHACGHDVHMAIALEVARAMAQRRARLSGRVRFVFPPAAPMVITLGSIHGGTAANIVAGEVVIQGTLRSLDPGLRTNMLRRIAELAEGIATAMRGHCEFKLESAAPPVINDGRVAAMVADAARGVVGDDAVVAFEPLMVGEDFAYFLQARPGCFFLLGGAPEGPRVGHHTPEFRIDERCLSIGFQVMTAAVLRLLQD